MTTPHEKAAEALRLADHCQGLAGLRSTRATLAMALKMADKTIREYAALLQAQPAEALSQEQERALRLADDAAQSVVCSGGQGQTAYHWFLTHDQIAADPYLEDCIAHLVWRGMAHRLDADDGVQVVFNEEPW